MIFEFSRQMLEKRANIKFHENPSNWSRVFRFGRTEGRTDRHDEGNSQFSKFCEGA